MIKILIADDHLLVRQGIRALLEAYNDVEVIGEAEDGQEAYEMAKKLKPDIVLMDLLMPRLSGTEAMTKILAKMPEVKIIALTSYIDKQLIEESLKSGALGYVLKNISGDELLLTIKNVSQGKSSLSSEASDLLISNLKNPDADNYQLTSQERNILACLVEGQSNKEIARKQVLSISTVKFHVSNILNKLGASSRAEAVSIALKKNLTE